MEPRGIPWKESALGLQNETSILKFATKEFKALLSTRKVLRLFGCEGFNSFWV